MAYFERKRKKFHFLRERIMFWVSLCLSVNGTSNRKKILNIKLGFCRRSLKTRRSYSPYPKFFKIFINLYSTSDLRDEYKFSTFGNSDV